MLSEKLIPIAWLLAAMCILGGAVGIQMVINR